MLDYLPVAFALYANQMQHTMSGTEVLAFGAGVGIIVIAFMVLHRGLLEHRQNKKTKLTPKYTLATIREARIQCAVEFSQTLAMLDTRKINLRRDRRELDAVTLQCSAERGNLDTMPMFEALLKAEDVFVDSYRWTVTVASEISQRIGTLDRIIAIGEDLEKKLREHNTQDAQAQPSPAQVTAVLIVLSKELTALRDLRQSVQEDCNETAAFLQTIKQQVHVEGDGPGAKWIAARHSGVLHRLAPKKAS